MIRFNYLQAKEVLDAFSYVESGFTFNAYLNVNGTDVDVEVYSYQEKSSILTFTVSRLCFKRLQCYGFTFDYVKVNDGDGDNLPF